MADHAVPEPSFASAMEMTTLWLRQWEAGELSEEVLADRVGELVASRDGARGFFVVALAGDGPLMDRLPDVLVLQLRRAGAAVVDLTARNLAMSTAMAEHHRRVGDGAQQGRSLRVQRRCQELLQQLESALVTSRLETLLAGTADVGVDRDFLERWGYDQEQKKAIAAAIEAVAMA